MHDAKIRRIAVNVFGPARIDIETSKRIIPRHYHRIFLSRDDDEPYTEEERLKDQEEDARASKEANERADAELAEIAALEAKSAQEPVVFRGSSSLPDSIRQRLSSEDGYAPIFTVYKDKVYRMEGPFTNEEFALLTYRQFEREMRFFTKIESRKTRTQNAAGGCGGRPKIAASVQREVWNRDGGRCVLCGSNQNIEFDHIIPFSKGGSSTTRNLQLLCEPCNAQKGDEI